jgi:hypothetical protein
MADSYLENAMDYVQETFESANEWMKTNDPFPHFGLPGAEAEESCGANDGGISKFKQGFASSILETRYEICSVYAGDGVKAKCANNIEDIVDRLKKTEDAYQIGRLIGEYIAAKP